MTLVRFWLYGVGMARGKHHLLCGPGGMGTIVKSLTVLASPPGMTPLGVTAHHSPSTLQPLPSGHLGSGCAPLRVVPLFGSVQLLSRV